MTAQQIIAFVESLEEVCETVSVVVTVSTKEIDYDYPENYFKVDPPKTAAQIAIDLGKEYLSEKELALREIGKTIVGNP